MHTMSDMRYRIPEVYKDRNLTAYRVAKLSGGTINYTTLYRLEKRRGKASTFDGPLIEALAHVLKLEDPGDVLQFDGKRRKTG